MTIPEKITLLLTGRWKGELLSDTDAEALDHWLSSPTNAEKAEALHQIWSVVETYPSHYSPNVEAGWNKLQARVAAQKAQAAKAKIVSIHRRRWILAVASVLLLFTAGYNWWMAQQVPIQVHTIAATSGRPLEIALPDGSLVVLHDGGEVSYPDPFEKSKSRWMELSGEAYFKIAPDSNKPFQVRTAHAVVEVLGTAFNVRALPEESVVEVTVESGRVQLAPTTNSGSALLLQSGERGQCSPEGELLKSTDENINALSWLTEKLRFRKTPLPQALEALNRHYNIVIDLETESLVACTYTGSFEQAPQEDVLKTLELTFGARMIKQSEDRYVLRGGACGN